MKAKSEEIPSPSKPQLGELLRRWRQDRSLSQENAARQLGVAATTWSHWETGRRLPTPCLLLLLRELTGISLGSMLCENAHRCPFSTHASTLSRDRNFDNNSI